jgi:AcrR family transcriptional regulator
MELRIATLRCNVVDIADGHIWFLTLPVHLTYILVGMFVRKHPTKGKRKGKLRDPERTRELLLQAASREIYRSGFQSASLDTILASAGVTKGALYYHFDSKEALGYAVVEEVIAPDVRGVWLRPLQRGKDPIAALIGIVQGISVRPEDVRGGCPLNNLAQEMSPLDAGFRKRLSIVFDAWRKAIASVLREGQTHGSVRRDVEPADAAGLLIAMVEGYGSLAKNAQDPKVMKAGIRNIVGWLRSLSRGK